ncbi:hypothetical protein [Cellulosimicrobium funkei]|uniref:hypothetical protein n=1 Tax=Cellulosimicrobium funkei TaxID=264251 RepID=UPI0036AEE48B
MSRETGSTPTPPDDDFLLRLRRTADDAVPPSTLDLDVVLRSSRRGAQRRRSLAGVAGVVALGLVGTGVVTAGGPGGVRELAREVVTGSPGYEVLVAEPTTVDVAPGVVAVAEPATYLRDDGTYVLDLGLGAWRDGDRFFVEYDPGSEAEGSAPAMRVVAGDSGDLRRLRRGEDVGTVVSSGHAKMAIVERAASDERLVLGLSPLNGDGELWAVLADEVTDATGASVTSLVVPTSVHGGRVLSAMLLGTSAAPGPEIRGLTSYDTEVWSTETCESAGQGEDGFSDCRTEYDPRTGRSDALLREPPTGDPAVLGALRSVVEERGDPDVYALLDACLDARGEPGSTPATGGSLDVPPGVRGDTWRQCLMDAALVRDEFWRDHRDAQAAG